MQDTRPDPPDHSCYVENNPVRAKIVEKPYEYKWSSARGHIYGEAAPILSDDCFLIKEIDDWLAYFMGKDKWSLLYYLNNSVTLLVR